jgi:hypothetical protein
MEKVKKGRQEIEMRRKL